MMTAGQMQRTPLALVDRLTGAVLPLSPGSHVVADLASYVVRIHDETASVRVGGRPVTPILGRYVPLFPEQKSITLVVPGADAASVYYLEGQRPELPPEPVVQSLERFSEELVAFGGEDGCLSYEDVVDYELVDRNLMSLRVEEDPFLRLVRQSLLHFEEAGHRPRSQLELDEEEVPTRYVGTVGPASVQHLLQHPRNWAAFRGGRPVPSDLMTEVTRESHDLYENRFVYAFHALVLSHVNRRLAKLQLTMDNHTKTSRLELGRRAAHVRSRRGYRRGDWQGATEDLSRFQQAIDEYLKLKGRLERMRGAALWRHVGSGVPIPAATSHALRTAPHYRQLYAIHLEWCQLMRTGEEEQRSVERFPLAHADHTRLAVIQALWEMYFDAANPADRIPLSSMSASQPFSLQMRDPLRGLTVTVQSEPEPGAPIEILVTVAGEEQQVWLQVRPIFASATGEAAAGGEARATARRWRGRLSSYLSAGQESGGGRRRRGRDREAELRPEKILVIHPTLAQSLGQLTYDEVRLLYGYGDNFIDPANRTPENRRTTFLPGGFHDALTISRMQRWLRVSLEHLGTVVACPNCGSPGEPHGQHRGWRCPSCQAIYTEQPAQPTAQSAAVPCPHCGRPSRESGAAGERHCTHCQQRWITARALKRYVRCPHCGGRAAPGDREGDRVCTECFARWGSRDCASCQHPTMKILLEPSAELLEQVSLWSGENEGDWAELLDSLVGSLGANSICEDQSDLDWAFTGLYVICPECGSCGPPERKERRRCRRCDLKQGCGRGESHV